ncbi:WD40 repeat domain-containing protein [Streptomyces kaempferi]
MTRVWDPADGELAGELQTDRDGADYALAVVTTREGDLLFAAGGEDGAVRLRDWRTGAMVRELPHVGAVRAMSLFTGLGGQVLLATAGEDGVVRLWDPLTEAMVGELETVHVGGVRSMSVFTGLGGQPLLATAGEDGTVGLRNLMSGQDVSGPLRHCSGVTAVAAYPLSDREAMLVTGGDDGTVRFWNCETGAEALTIPLGLRVHDVAYVEGNLALATAEGLLQVSLEAGSNLASKF